MGGDPADTPTAPPVEAGTPTSSDQPQVAGRYRIETRLSLTTERRVGQLWRAHDDVLARPVAVLLIPTSDPLATQVLANARAAAQLTHAAVVRVYDAGEEDDQAFVVMEFLSGGSLETQLLAAPLEPAVAIDVAADLAAGVAAAHDVGLSGLALTPRSVLFTATGAPRLTGLGPTAQTDEHDGSAEDDDTVGLAHLLYAALTARWPGPEPASALPAAPLVDGHLRTPRQVRGGVPREVDAVVTQALGDDEILRGLEPITSVPELAAALAALRGVPDAGHPYGADTQPIVGLDPRPGRLPSSGLRAARHWRRWAAIVAAALVCVAIVGLFFPGSAGYRRFVTGAAQPTATPTATAPAKTATAKPTTGIALSAVSEFDPYGNHDDPHVSEAPLAMDGNPATAWRTQTYRTADLGKLKPGVGLLVDLGTAQSVTGVTVRLVGTGTSLTLFESNGPTPPATEKAMTAVAQQSAAPVTVTLRPSAPVKARYWLVWLTQLPAVAGGFQGGIAEMTFLH